MVSNDEIESERIAALVSGNYAWQGVIAKTKGLTEDQYFALGVIQHRKCGVCKCNLRYDSYTCLDHNHETNKPRGLLCHRCNVIVGIVESGRTIHNLASEVLIYLKHPPASLL